MLKRPIYWFNLLCNGNFGSIQELNTGFNCQCVISCQSADAGSWCISEEKKKAWQVAKLDDSNQARTLVRQSKPRRR